MSKFLYQLRNLRNRSRELTLGRTHQLNVGGTPIRVESELRATVIRANGKSQDLGVLSRRVVTTAGVGFIVDAFQNLTELENMKFHAAGTGSVAEAVGDTALGTEVESRNSGTNAEASANQYQTVGTVAFTATRAITEHGVFSASTAGVLLDRSVFTAINVVNGDSIQFTYTLTVTAGG